MDKGPIDSNLPRRLAASTAYRFEFLPHRRRMVATYFGMWNVLMAREALNAFRQALETICANAGQFTLLDDFRQWQVQSPEVNNLANEFEAVLRSFPVKRNAMVIPDSVVRMQVRRTLTDFHKSSIFAAYDEAEAWLAEVEPKA